MIKTMNRTMTQTMSITIAALALVVPAAAQDQAFERQAALVEKLQVERARLSVESRVTKGAPVLR